jgi:hypothetical protein
MSLSKKLAATQPRKRKPPREPQPNVLGRDPNKGQYRIPLIGEAGKRENIRRYDRLRKKSGRGITTPTPGSVFGRRSRNQRA